MATQIEDYRFANSLIGNGAQGRNRATDSAIFRCSLRLRESLAWRASISSTWASVATSVHHHAGFRARCPQHRGGVEVKAQLGRPNASFVGGSTKGVRRESDEERQSCADCATRTCSTPPAGSVPSAVIVRRNRRVGRDPIGTAIHRLAGLIDQEQPRLHRTASKSPQGVFNVEISTVIAKLCRGGRVMGAPSSGR